MAAALAYGLDREDEQTIMVYDLGGGTFDITIMRVAKGEIEVLATGGDKNLGSFNWDNKVMEFLKEQFQKEGGPDLFEDSALQHDLRDKAEIAKKTLSSRDNAKVFLSASGKTASVSISRDDFERVTADLLSRPETLMEMTLEDAQLSWAQIDKVLLVGGSTRMKSVPALIERVSGKKPSAELQPDEVVAIGAALLASILQKESGQGALSHLDGLPAVKISDVNSHSLGVVAVDGRTGRLYNSIILPRNSKYHTRASASSMPGSVSISSGIGKRILPVGAKRPRSSRPFELLKMKFSLRWVTGRTAGFPLNRSTDRVAYDRAL